MPQKSTVKKRITTFINHLGITKYEFYKLTGITRGILDQDNGITESNIVKFAECYPEVNINWLILGRGHMLLNSDELSLLKGQHSFTIESTAQSSLPLIPTDRLGQYLANPKTQELSEYQHDYFQSEFSDVDFFTRVRDLSLFPLYSSGDIIACKIINDKDFIQWNKIYLLATNQGIIIKRILEGKDEDHFKMSSDNPSFHSFEISKTDIKAMAIIRGGIHLE